MSDKKTEGHWESKSCSSHTTKVGNQPSVTVGKEASAEGAFDHGKPVVIDAHSASFTDKGHPGTLEYKEGGDQKSIK